MSKGLGRKIKYDLDVYKISKQIYGINGLLLTAPYLAKTVAREFSLDDKQAQKVAQDLIEQDVKKGNLVPDTPRKCPQRYWPKSALEMHKVPASALQQRAKLREILGRADGVPRYIHKLQLKTKMQEDIWEIRKGSFRFDKYNDQQWINMNATTSNMPYVIGFSKNGTVQVFTKISRKPFRLESDEDIDKIVINLSQLRGWLLARGFYGLPEIEEWILQRCDINKDIPLKRTDMIGDDLNMSFKDAVGEFRIYVKTIADQKFLRTEHSKDFNEEVKILDGLQNACSEPVLPPHFG